MIKKRPYVYITTINPHIFELNNYCPSKNDTSCCDSQKCVFQSPNANVTFMVFIKIK
jgi:hypothetical protein